MVKRQKALLGQPNLEIIWVLMFHSLNLKWDLSVLIANNGYHFQGSWVPNIETIALSVFGPNTLTWQNQGTESQIAREK